MKKILKKFEDIRNPSSGFIGWSVAIWAKKSLSQGVEIISKGLKIFFRQLVNEQNYHL